MVYWDYLQSPQFEAAYAYINWWLSVGLVAITPGRGFTDLHRNLPAATLLDRNGIIGAGRPASESLYDNRRFPRANPGDTRVGRHETRKNVVVWNSVMRNYDYTIRKWYEFITA